MTLVPAIGISYWYKQSNYDHSSQKQYVFSVSAFKYHPVDMLSSKK